MLEPVLVSFRIGGWVNNQFLQSKSWLEPWQNIWLGLRDRDWSGVLALHLATILWASTFLVVKDAVGNVPPSLLIFCRFAFAAVVLVSFLRRSSLALWLAGLENALWFTLIYATQTFGLQVSSASQGAFISALYVVLVPLILRFSGRRVRLIEWWAAITAIFGTWLLSGNGQSGEGGLWFVASTVFSAIQTVRGESLSKRFSSWPLTAATVVCGVGLSLVWVAFDHPVFRLEAMPWLALAFLGVVVTGFGTWLMAFGQARVSGTRTAVIFALEPVWAAALAGMFLAERLGVFGWFGGALVIAANVLPQWFTDLYAKRQPVSSSPVSSPPVSSPVEVPTSTLAVMNVQRWRLENTRTGVALEFDRLADLRSWLERDEVQPELVFPMRDAHRVSAQGFREVV